MRWSCRRLTRGPSIASARARTQVLAIVRPSFARRGPLYSQYGCTIRCVRPDQSAVSIGVHYLNDGDAMLRFSWRKREYSIPVVLVLKVRPETAFSDVRVPPRRSRRRAPGCSHRRRAGAGRGERPRHLRRHCPGRRPQDVPDRARGGDARQGAPVRALHAPADAGVPGQPLRRGPVGARVDAGRAARRAAAQARPVCAPDRQPRQVPAAHVRRAPSRGAAYGAGGASSPERHGRKRRGCAAPSAATWCRSSTRWRPASACPTTPTRR